MRYCDCVKRAKTSKQKFECFVETDLINVQQVWRVSKSEFQFFKERYSIESGAWLRLKEHQGQQNINLCICYVLCPSPSPSTKFNESNNKQIFQPMFEYLTIQQTNIIINFTRH